MQTWKELRKELLKNQEVRTEYERLKPRYQLISQLIEARAKMGMTQKELAERIGTKQSAIARIESGSANPSFDFLQKITRALDSKLIILIK